MSKLKAFAITLAFLVLCATCVGIICLIPPEPLITVVVGIGLVVAILTVVEFVYDILHGGK